MPCGYMSGLVYIRLNIDRLGLIGNARRQDCEVKVNPQYTCPVCRLFPPSYRSNGFLYLLTFTYTYTIFHQDYLEITAILLQPDSTNLIVRAHTKVRSLTFYETFTFLTFSLIVYADMTAIKTRSLCIRNT